MTSSPAHATLQPMQLSSPCNKDGSGYNHESVFQEHPVSNTCVFPARAAGPGPDGWRVTPRATPRGLQRSAAARHADVNTARVMLPTPRVC
jgi:hypothetical protein